MTMQVRRPVIGIDVAKDELVIHQDDSKHPLMIENSSAAIRQWLAHLPTECDIAIEATSTYHMEVTERAHARGHQVYVIDGYRLKNYREGVGGRAKTDVTDAQLLARYLSKEKEELRQWTPPPKAYRLLQSLLRRRAALVKARTALRQSLGGEPVLKQALQTIIKHMDRIDRLIQQHLGAALKAAGLSADVQRCRAIDGVGDITAAALVMAFLRGDFRNSDAFIAFLGLDVRVRDSGKSRGKRKLTKKGDSEVRRLLHCAAMSASRQSTWAAFYQRYRERGLKTTQALVILARKIARVAFTLMKRKEQYRPAMLFETCKAP